MIIGFPRAALGRPSEKGATRLDILRSRIREAIGRALNKIGVPGAIKDAEIKDAVTGQELTVCVSPWFVRINVDGRDYFFNRITGRFDGTGTGCF